MTVTQKKRSAVYARDEHRCAACGRSDQLSIQHRKNKGMGGSKLLDGFENLLTMCVGCNTALESDARFAESGRRNGWKLATGSDATQIPVFFAWAREWRLLDLSGDFTPTT